MVSLHTLKEPIPQDTRTGQLASEELRESLENLQGNILRGHGRDHAVHTFLHFKDGKRQEVKQWLQGLAQPPEPRITSAQQQLDDRERSRLFMSVFLSAEGYDYLEFPFPKTPGLFDDVAFPQGMKKAQLRLNDPLPEDWDAGYRGNIHAMVLLAHNKSEDLFQAQDTLLNEIKAHTDPCAVEYGKVMWNNHGNRVEHFGYVDGRSHLLLFQGDINREKQNEGANVLQPALGVGSAEVLVPDPYGKIERPPNRLVQYYHSGSYFVFRKLEQDVRSFKYYEEQLARALELPAEDAKRAGALIIGRFEDGTPVARYNRPEVRQSIANQPAPVPNNFTYEHDPEGQKCPLHAHIRKINPRDPRSQHIPRIVRRGITYGTREKEPKDNPRPEECPTRGDGAGLLFMCYQKNIREHFEFLQREWANDPNFPKQGTGTDPIIGQPGNMEMGEHKWPVEWGGEQQKPVPVPRFVTLKGGEYFFAPSLYFFRTLGEA